MLIQYLFNKYVNVENFDIEIEKKEIIEEKKYNLFDRVIDSYKHISIFNIIVILLIIYILFVNTQNLKEQFSKGVGHFYMLPSYLSAVIFGWIYVFYRLIIGYDKYLNRKELLGEYIFDENNNKNYPLGFSNIFLYGLSSHSFVDNDILKNQYENNMENLKRENRKIKK